MSKVTRYRSGVGVDIQRDGFFAGLRSGFKESGGTLGKNLGKGAGFFSRVGQKISAHNKNLGLRRNEKAAATNEELREKIESQTLQRKLKAGAPRFYKQGYRNVGAVVAEHRKRVLAKEEYRLKRLQLKGAQAESRQLIPPNSKRSIRPLGDKQFINPSARLNAGIRKSKGPGPLSDKNFARKVKEMKDGEI